MSTTVRPWDNLSPTIYVGGLHVIHRASRRAGVHSRIRGRSLDRNVGDRFAPGLASNRRCSIPKLRIVIEFVNRKNADAITSRANENFYRLTSPGLTSVE